MNNFFWKILEKSPNEFFQDFLKKKTKGFFNLSGDIS